MNKKLCLECSLKLSRKSFHKNALMKDGLHYYCKKCTSTVQKKWRDTSKAYANYLPKRRKRLSEKRKDGRYKARDLRNSRNSRLRYPDRVAARQAAANAIRRGDIIKPKSCSACNKKTVSRKLHGHHHNGYDKPLDIVWICTVCHSKEHNPRYRALMGDKK